MLQKSTLEFLIQLKENNDRDWFAANKKAFETEQKLAKSFFTSVGDQLGKIDSIDQTAKNLANKIHKKILKDIKGIT